METFQFLLAGFFLGIEHAFDSDHIAAVSTIISERRSVMRSLFVGLYWGLGHTSMLMLVGIAIILFNITIPAMVASAAEIGVGVVLIALGVNALKNSIHAHLHKHEDNEHIHLHQHLFGEHKHSHAKKSFVIGLLHGLAGSAALMLLLLGQAPDFTAAIYYITIFGSGSIIGMILITLAIALPIFLGDASWLNRARIIAGILSILVGFNLIYSVGILYG